MAGLDENNYSSFEEFFVSVMTTRGYGPRPDTTNPTTEADPNLPEDGNKPLMRGAKSARDPEDPLQGPATKRVKMEHDDDPSPVQMPQSVATPLPRHWAFADQPPTPPPEKPVNRGQEKILESLGMHTFEILENLGTSAGKRDSPDYQACEETAPMFEFMWKRLSGSDGKMLAWKDLDVQNTTHHHRMVRLANLARFGLDLFAEGRSCLPSLHSRFLQVFVYGMRGFHKSECDIYLELTAQLAIFQREESSDLETLTSTFKNAKEALRNWLEPRGPGFDSGCTRFDRLAHLVEGELKAQWTTPSAVDRLLDTLLQHISRYIADEVASNPEVRAKFGFPGSPKITPENSTQSKANDWKDPQHDDDDFLKDLHNWQPRAVTDMPVQYPSPPEMLDPASTERERQAFEEMAACSPDSAELWERMQRELVDATIDEVNKKVAAQQPAQHAHLMQQAPGGQHQLSQYPSNEQMLAAHHTAMSQAGHVGDAALPPGQLSTAQIMNMARATSSKASPARREGANSSRKPWTKAEEDALLEGLDRVKGPHWSQILQYHGASGSIDQRLANRTQVQLKDKARNLKLWFLKQDREIPPFLVQVTGELKTRAPNQAAKREREEEEAKAQSTGPTTESLGQGQGTSPVDHKQISPIQHLAAAVPATAAVGIASTLPVVSVAPTTPTGLALGTHVRTTTAASMAPAAIPVSTAAASLPNSAASMPTVSATSVTSAASSAPAVPAVHHAVPNQSGFQGRAYTSTRTYTPAQAVSMTQITTPAMAQEAQLALAQRTVQQARIHSPAPATVIAATTTAPPSAPTPVQTQPVQRSVPPSVSPPVGTPTGAPSRTMTPATENAASSSNPRENELFERFNKADPDTLERLRERLRQAPPKP